MSANKPFNESNILEFQTIKPDPLKKLFEALKEVLVEVNLIFDTDGLKIQAMNNPKTALVYFKIPSSNLEHYYVKERFLAGINLISFFKQIKSGDSDDALFIYVNEDSQDTMHISFHNNESQSTAHYRLLNVEESEYNFPKIKYSSDLTIKAYVLQKFIKDLHQITRSIEIKNIGDELVFSTAPGNEIEDSVTKDHTLKVNSSTPETKNWNDISDEPEQEIIQGLFDIELMLRFSKATSINPNGFVKMYINNDQPMTLEYDIPSLGKLRFLISQKNQE